MTSIEDQWTGYPDSLQGLDNPLVDGGAIRNMQDYAKLLLMHLRGGKCGDTQVLSGESVAAMQVDRSGALEGAPLGAAAWVGLGWVGLGWWILANTDYDTDYMDHGFHESLRVLGDGYYMAFDDYSRSTDDLASLPAPVT